MQPRPAFIARSSDFGLKFRRCSTMRENDFRDRLRDALGDPPPLSAPLLTPSDGAARRAYPRGMAVLAFVLALLLVLVLVAKQVALRPQGTNLPAVEPHPCPPHPPDSFPWPRAGVGAS